MYSIFQNDFLYFIFYIWNKIEFLKAFASHNFKNSKTDLDLLFGKGHRGGVCYGFINLEVNHIVFWMGRCAVLQISQSKRFTDSPIRKIYEFSNLEDLWISKSRM